MTVSLEIPEKLHSVEEWLKLEKISDVRHEYYYGKLIPMAGEAKRANRISINLSKLLDDPLYEKGYVTFAHDVKAEVVPGGIYRYPDFIVAPISDEEDDYIVKQPVMLVEVASEESNYRDRVRKRKEYFKISSIWYYLIVSQDVMWAELHLKNEDERWETQYFTEPDDTIELKRFDIKFSLSDVYHRIKMEP
jgi:Uma2 family endonuclease